jgi:hypothetical protein
MMRHTLLLVAALAARTLGAQVGTTPATSPFRDIEKRQNVVLMFGQSLGGRDRAGAAPSGGQTMGIRYDLPLGRSPLLFTSGFVRQNSTRDILQPGLPIESRVGRNVAQPLYFVDVGLTLLATGNKSWRSMVPSLTGGLSVVTDNKGVTDSSQFSFGNRFGFHLNLGMKYAPTRSRWSARADIMNRFYSVKYPGTFRAATNTVPSIVPGNINADWTRNTVFSLGLVREIGRR